MAKLLSGRETAASLDERTRSKVSELAARGVCPTLQIIRVGEKESDLSYERGVKKRARSLGITVESTVFPDSVTEEDLLGAIEASNRSDAVHGVIVLRPLFKHLDERKIVNALDPSKDVDCMTDASLISLFDGSGEGFAPCTPQACLEILDHYGVSCLGKRAVVIGRSMVVGRPLAMMLLKRNATVTICHSKTGDLPGVAREADLLFAAAGKAGLVSPEFVRPGQTVIDVGINVGKDGALTGDVDFARVEPIVGALTGVPGGVGAVTTSVLLSHVAEAAERIFCSM